MTERKSCKSTPPHDLSQRSTRIAIHTQHFAGIGHRMRMMSLARVLSSRQHEVIVFDGGQRLRCTAPSSRDGNSASSEPRVVELPPIVKDVQLAPLDGSRSLEECLALRREIFRRNIKEMAPKVLITEFFPFSRWALRKEYFDGIAAARAQRKDVRVFCSLRDIPRTPFENRTPPDFQWDASLGRPFPVQSAEDFLDGVPRLLNEQYDAVLVHGDERVSRLKDHFPWISRIRIPIHYTGYIPQAGSALPTETIDKTPRPQVVVSVGGGTGGTLLLQTAMEAWRRLSNSKNHVGGTMVLFGGGFMPEKEIEMLQRMSEACGTTFRPFSPDFISWLASCDLSISRAGYNTVTAILAARKRAIFSPGPRVPDQLFRAKRLSELGLARSILNEELDSRHLANAIESSLRSAEPRHDLNLLGADRTAEILEQA